MYRIHEIKLGIEEDKGNIPDKIKAKLKTQASITKYKIVKESIDARDKGNIQYTYTVDFQTDAELSGLQTVRELSYVPPEQGTGVLRGRIVIAGFGPCGMFAALILAELGYAPLVIERGRCVEERVADVQRFWNEGILDTESNVQFGEGGAGTFSDGKLTTGIKDIRTGKVIEELVNAGAGEEIMYKQKPHIGTDVLKKTVQNLREKIISLGGEICFGTRLDAIETDEKGITAVKVHSEKGDGEIKTENLILAIGHSARDTVRILHKSGMEMEQKQFSIGVRIEHAQELIDKGQYGKATKKGILPPAEYKLSYRAKDGRGVYTFCMCPGGTVIAAASQEGHMVINGMSDRARAGRYANSAVLVDVKTSDFESDDPLAGILFQEKYERAAYMSGGENYKAPQTTWAEFESRTESAAPVLNSLPAFAAPDIIEAMPHFARKLKNFDEPGASVYAVESRSSSPVRIKRNESFQSNIAGIYPGGEGAGYAGGIVSAAVDGIRIAEEIVRNFKGGKQGA